MQAGNSARSLLCSLCGSQFALMRPAPGAVMVVQLQVLLLSYQTFATGLRIRMFPRRSAKDTNSGVVAV